MKRTTISLPDDLAAALGREAARRRTSVSQVAREAIEARLGWDD
jgi:predicted transcriptional regulator